LQALHERRQRAALVVEYRCGTAVIVFLPPRLHHLPQLVVDAFDTLMAGGHRPLALQIDHTLAALAQRGDGLAMLKLADAPERGRGQFLAGHNVVQAPRRIIAGGLHVADHAGRDDV
jgi:hypothetical protein